MNPRQANRLAAGLLATERGVRLNRELKRIEVQESSGRADGRVVKTFQVFDSTVEGFRVLNIQTLIAVHEFTDGGKDRAVDSTILAGWKALSLPDKSAAVTLDGYLINPKDQSASDHDPSFDIYPTN